MKPAQFLMRIPADKHGYRLVEDMKTSLNSDGYRLFVRYSGKRRTYFGGHTRKEDATSMRVYIEQKNAPKNETSRVKRELKKLLGSLDNADTKG